MPPKRASGKSDKDRKKQEEAARKAQEEEEQRLRDEEERHKREEEFRLQREEEERLKAEEKARFEVETSQLIQVKEKLTEKVQEFKKKEREDREWQHYISCNPLPAVTDDKALNTYFSLYKEKPCAKSMEESFNRIEKLLELLDNIEKSLKQEEEARSTANYVNQIHDLIQSEIDQATRHAMDNPNDHIDPETFNLILESKIPALTYCLWCNIVKNPRLKDFTFQLRGFNLELPKSMLLADVAVRVMYPTYDILSPLCRTYTCPISHSNESSEPTESVLDIQENSQGNTTDEDMGNRPDDKDEVNSQLSGEKTSVPSSKTSRNGSAKSSVMDQKVTEEIPQEAITSNDDREEHELKKEGEDSNLSDIVESQKDGNDLDVDEVNMRCCSIAGGPILLDLLTLPPQPKIANNWTIKQAMMQGVVVAPHPVDASGIPSPISITLNLPDKYLFSEVEALQLAQWDKEKVMWRTGGLKEVNFDLSNKNVSFQMCQFAPLAIMTDTYINLPYQSWELLPLGINHTLFHITGGIVDLSLEIKDSDCILVKPSDDPITAELLNVPLSVPLIIKALTSVGFHFFPALDADKYTSLTVKNRGLEISVYEYMAMTSGGWGFQWSQWNNKGGQENVIIQATECSQDHWKILQKDPDPEQLKWNVYVTGTNKSYKLKISEDSNSFSDAIADGQLTHSELYTTLMMISFPVTLDLVNNTSPQHVHTVQQLLMATRPLVATC